MTSEEEEARDAAEWKLIHEIRPVLWEAYTKGEVKGLWDACHNNEVVSCFWDDKPHEEKHFLLGPDDEHFVVIVPVDSLQETSFEVRQTRGRAALEAELKSYPEYYEEIEQDTEKAYLKWEKDLRAILRKREEGQRRLDKRGVRSLLKFFTKERMHRLLLEHGAQINFTAERMQFVIGIPHPATYCGVVSTGFRSFSLKGAFGTGELEHRLQNYSDTGAIEKYMQDKGSFVRECLTCVVALMFPLSATSDELFSLIRCELEFMAGPKGGMTQYSFEELEELADEPDSEKRKRLFWSKEERKRDRLKAWREKNMVEGRESEVPSLPQKGTQSEISPGPLVMRVTPFCSFGLWLPLYILNKAGYFPEMEGNRWHSAFARRAVKGVVELMDDFPIKFSALGVVARYARDLLLRPEDSFELYPRSRALGLVTSESAETRLEHLTDIKLEKDTRRDLIRTFRGRLEEIHKNPPLLDS